ncbi:DNA topoisomerase 2-beta [Desmophyllum pertusum]|uniref:DNA topoisomerase (ATP-hydrolyzing) n=1 Tax=Desmophyllum pertusum TaxID=174260 RepID=A0A9X0CIR7_9CNID|nr:DNA topoisomerase 2-beta [Desmophyllum pertusum]
MAAETSPLKEIMNNGEKSTNNAFAAKKKKRMSVERIYQKKTQLEHILLRPDTYIGSVEPIKQNMWVYDAEMGAIVSKEITFVPGLYKIFDELLVNAADNKQRDPSMGCIKINIDAENNSISVWNDGRGIPVEIHKEQNVFVPTLIFGQL